jgi:hypothetical protein
VRFTEPADDGAAAFGALGVFGALTDGVVLFGAFGAFGFRAFVDGDFGVCARTLGAFVDARGVVY